MRNPDECCQVNHVLTPSDYLSDRELIPDIATNNFDVGSDLTRYVIQPPPGIPGIINDERSHLSPLSHQGLDKVRTYESSGPRYQRPRGIHDREACREVNSELSPARGWIQP